MIWVAVWIVFVALLVVLIYAASLHSGRPEQKLTEWDDSTQLFEWKDRVRRDR